MNTLKPDICVIGAGAAGLSVAAAAAALGVSTVLIEKGEMGGDCLNSGCVPSKALLAAAAHARTLREGAQFGVAPVAPDVDFAAVRAHLDRVRAEIAPHDSAERFRALGVTVLRETARFVSASALEAGATRVLARRFVVASGAEPATPHIPGLDLVRYWTSATIFGIERLPARLVVIGAGPVGLELAQAFARLGAATTVVDAGVALAREDRELVAPLLRRLREEGVRILESAAIRAIEPVGAGARLILDGETLDAPALLVAAGRRPRVEGLGLDAAGVAYDETGVKVGRDLRTSNRRIYAIGDCNGGPQFTHAGSYQAGLVIRATLFRLSAPAKPERIPRVVYTDPEVAWVGLSEDEARARHKRVRVLRAGFAENDRARAERQTDGHVKLIVTDAGRIVGGGLCGRSAGELVSLIALAIDQGMTARALADLVIPYPTLAETLKRAAASDLARLAAAPRTRTLVSWLRRLG